MKKRIAALLMTGIMAVSMLAGCGGSGASSETATSDASAASSAAGSSAADDSDQAASDGETIELEYWTLSALQEDIDQVVDEFNNSQDQIHVTVSYYDVDGIKDACKVAAQSGNLPDMWFNYGGSLGSYYAENGASYDLTEYAAEHDWANKFNPGALSLCELDGQLAGYPTTYNVLGMFYRKDIFEQYGIEIPTTFEEFEAVCEKLKENGVTPVSTAGLYGWHVMRMVEQFIEYYAGQDKHDAMNVFEESWDNEAVVQALTKYKEFCDKGYFPDGFITADPNNTLMGMGSGSCAMDIQGHWYDDDIINAGLDVNQFGWFPFPNGTDRMSAFVELVQFNADLSDAELDACMTFMDSMQTEEHAADGLVVAPLPTKDAVMPGEDHPNVASMFEYSAEHGTFTITDQALPADVADVLFSCQEAICNGSMTPEEGAAQIQKSIEENVK